ncbi:c-terminal processing peptidase [Clostridium sp. CAG:417]|nr:c-terminal processing peptidase [Clostridium sp. CAG:417]
MAGRGRKKEKIIKEKESSVDDITTNMNREYFSNYEVIIIIVISVVFGGILGSIITLNREKSSQSNNELDEFITTYNSITTNYYKNVDNKKLINAAIKGMVNYLDDPYSIYMDEDDTENFTQTVNGQYEGVGVSVSKVDNSIEIVAIFKDSPADKAGLKPGDKIIKVNNKDVSGMELDDVVKLIKNKKKVNIIVKRDNKEKEITLKQNTVVIPSVSSRIVESNNKKVGVLNVSIFAANTYKQFKNKLDDLENKKIDSLIIDVRQNSGGHLDQVSKILSLFMKQDKVIYQIKTKKGVEKYYSTGKKSKNYNVVVLIDNSSASASEILAAAMNESYGATLMGEKTYGKGTVQKEYMLSSGASIKYTVEKWFTPKGKSINGKGISPTIEVALSDEYANNPTDENDNQLQEAIKFLTEEKKTN